MALVRDQWFREREFEFLGKEAIIQGRQLGTISRRRPVMLLIIGETDDMMAIQYREGRLIDTRGSRNPEGFGHVIISASTGYD
jgi:hypothetical protein